MKIIVTGATGLVGAEVLRQSIKDDEIEEVTAIVRKSLEVTHPKIKTILHSDFLDYSDLETVFKSNDAIAWCLGISQSQVSRETYHVITHDYTIAAAEAIFKVNPGMAFLFTSGAGADPTEKSSTTFARVKGKTENSLRSSGLEKLYIIRPAGIKPIHKNPSTSLLNKLFIPLFPIFELITPQYVITSVELAKAILNVLKNGNPDILINNKKLKKLAVS